jgi:hypothetical protein
MQRFKDYKIVLTLFMMAAFFFALFACQGMTPKQNVSALMKTYNKSYDDYMVRVKQPGLTADQIKNLKLQKQILTELHSKILLYDEYVVAGNVPLAGIEAEIDSLLLRLEKLILQPPPK